ncbi:MAG: hypothetical protein Ct9H300mP20_19300 [Gammaproteobacteria bacterium]|nr:MAG: hypothetical protein Ct9H300mP20_19300 [Gammaproteobacteria bacterium]
MIFVVLLLRPTQKGVNFFVNTYHLVSQVDASVGVKKAINHPKGKKNDWIISPTNQSLIDLSFPFLPSEREIKSGMVEMIKKWNHRG